MYEMAHKAREAMKGKAKRLAGEKDSKTDSSDWTPAEPLKADVKTGMRPISKQGFKKGGKVMGEKADCHAGRKPRKSGGRALTADSLVNRNVKEANESREGEKHIGGMKKGGKVKKKEGGFLRTLGDRVAGDVVSDEAIKLKDRLMGNLSSALSGESYKKGGRAGKMSGGANKNGGYTPRAKWDESKEKWIPLPPKAPFPGSDKEVGPMRPSDSDNPDKFRPGEMKKGGRAKKALGGMPADALKGTMNPAAVLQAVRNATMGMKKGGRSERKAGGNVNYGPQEMPAGKKAPSTAQQISEEKREQGMSKPSRGKAGHYADGGAPVPVTLAGPTATPGINMSKDVMNFGVGAKGSPYKKGGKAEKHEDIAEDKALIKKMVKPEARTKKYGGGALGALNMGPGKAAGGPSKGKKGMNVAITINTQPQAGADQMAAGMPGVPPGLPPRPTGGGIPVPMGMPAVGGTPPAAAPMPMPMAAPPAGGGLPPMARKAGGKVYRSYKDMDAGAGSGLGRLEKTEIQKRKG